jgi:hypothetical protein
MIEAFRMGGWGMFPTALFGLVLIAATIRYAQRPERRFVPLQLSLGIMTIASGGLGFVTGVIKSLSAMEGVQPDKKWIWMLGVSESLHNVALALALVTLGSVIAGIGALRLARGEAASAA